MGIASPQSSIPPKPHLVRYELVYPLGSGGMGTVWVARATREPEKFFIVKTLLPEHADDHEFREMFFEEARIASAITHENVARIFDLGDEDGTPYLVMEIVDGESLESVHRAMKKQGTLIPPQIALRIVADVCAGLHAAHELRDLSGQLRDVVHRDVSPHNVLIGMNGVAKVIDFGIAKARDRAVGTTAAGAIKGKIRYMSPEQAAGKPIDRRADIWATGVVLYLLLSGRYVVDGPHEPGILTELLFGEGHPPLPDSVSAGTRRVVEMALERDLSSRYATAEDMRLGIEGALGEMGFSVSSEDVAAFMTANFSETSAKRNAALEGAKSGHLPHDFEMAQSDATLDGTRFGRTQTVLASEGTSAEQNPVPSVRIRTSAPLLQTPRNPLPIYLAIAAVVAVAATLSFVVLSSSRATTPPDAPARTPRPTPIAWPATIPTTTAQKNGGSHPSTKAVNHGHAATPSSTGADASDRH